MRKIGSSMPEIEDLILLAVLSLFGMTAATAALTAFAPTGYEDETGFHIDED